VRVVVMVFCCFDAMTVGTAYLALRDFVLECFKTVSSTYQGGYVVVFVTLVVKL